jgi:hypothetical protein
MQPTHKQIVNVICKAFGNDLSEYHISKIVKNCTGKSKFTYDYHISQVITLDDYEMGKMIGILNVLINENSIFEEMNA